MARSESKIQDYFDHYSGAKYHEGLKSTDMKSWHDISPSLSFPKGIRHGTVSTVPESIVEKIQNH